MSNELLVFIYSAGLLPNLALPLLLSTKPNQDKKMIRFLFIMSLIPVLNNILLIVVFISLTISIIKHKD